MEDVSLGRKAQSLKIGAYKHFKGGNVEVIGIARHTETLEEMVVYRHTKQDGIEGLWVRPLSMFLEEIEKDGRLVPRFQYVGNEK